MKNVSKIITICVLALFAAVTYGQQITLTRSGSGFSYPSEAADFNGDMFGGSVSINQANGTFGRSTGNVVADLSPWDELSFCDFDPVTGAPRGALVIYDSSSQIIQFANGDLLYLRKSDNPESTLCFNIIDLESFTFEIYRDIVGGTGKFEGATGTYVTIGSGKAVAPGHSGNEFEATAEILLSK